MPTRRASRTSTSTKVRKPVNKQVPFRKKGPPIGEWERVKPLVRRYYIEERRKLAEVRTLLLNEHNFDAKEHMLKERLTQWGFRKNFKNAEHEIAAKEAKRRADLGLKLPVDMEFDGKPCAWDRVYRHFGKQYGCSSLRSGSQWDALISKVALKTSIDDHNIEMSLIELKRYWSVIIARNETFASIKASRKAARVRDCPVHLEVRLLGALNLMRNGRADQGWREMSQTCAAVFNVIRLQEPSLLSAFISIFSSSLWADHPELYIVVAKHFLSACHVFLKAKHPLISVLTTLTNLPLTSQIVDDFTGLAYQVMVDTVEEHKDQVKLDGYYIYSVEDSLVTELARRLDRSKAYELVQTKYFHYRRALGPRSKHTLSTQLHLAKMYLFDAARMQGPDAKHRREISEQKGKKILSEIVKQGKKYPRDRSRTGAYCIAAKDLARHLFAQQDYRGAQKYYCLALFWASNQFDRPHPFVSLLLREFDALQKMGELGLVDIKMPENEQHNQCGEKARAQSCQEMEACEVSCDAQFESVESIESDGLIEVGSISRSEPTLPPNFTSGATHDSGTGVIDGNMSPGSNPFVYTTEEDFWAQYMQGIDDSCADGLDITALDDF
ncbi:hypothetical protein AYO21_07208 [Fonsecaea monophora]|uniref:Clr5 domain-containing protein n=1 Tax=Fonsecaea monophora TaxID=254056 RepID=A0A177F2S7_9EURO|nr:hypothetical protein AYO21_07208 [Fonsecaea monophora]OAG38548.1 hypothetical protein AYO21_07208 [Fonsecaea monophora]